MGGRGRGGPQLIDRGGRRERTGDGRARTGRRGEVPARLTLATEPAEPGLRRVPRAWLLGGALAVAAVYLLLHSAFFLVRQVRVDGLVQLRRDDVAAAADIVPGTYLWQVRPWTVARRVAALPLVASVRVRLHWPDTIDIQLVERRPAVLLDVGANADLEVDASGRVVALAAPPGTSPPPGLLPAPSVPVVEGVAAAGARPGTQIDDLGLQHAIAVAEGLGVQGQALLGTLRVDPNGSVTAVLRSGVRVRFGDGSDARQKAELLLGLLGVIATRHLDVDQIDLASTQSPSVHLRTATATATSGAQP